MWVEAAVDRERDAAGSFLLTGSQSLGLMQSVSDSLAGRAAVVELEPLSFAEARAAHCGRRQVRRLLNQSLSRRLCDRLRDIARRSR